MFKKLMLLSAITSVSACSSYNEIIKCDIEKNYVISDPQAIEEYKNLYNNNKIKSIFYENDPVKECKTDACLQFDYESFDFVERAFHDKEREGIYKVYVTKDINRKDCAIHNSVSYGLKNYCFYTVKNEDGIINSEYKKSTKITKGIIFVDFSNIKTKKSLYKSSSQSYSTGAIGAYGIGICKAKNNNPDYKVKIEGVL